MYTVEPFDIDIDEMDEPNLAAVLDPTLHKLLAKRAVYRAIERLFHRRQYSADKKRNIAMRIAELTQAIQYRHERINEETP